MVAVVVPLLVLAASLSAAACSRRSLAKRVVPGVSTGSVSELTESALSIILVCHDTLGLLASDGVRQGRVGQCRPCMPYGAMAEGRGALRHARALVEQAGRAPHDTAYLAAGCTTLAFETARRASPEDLTIDVDFALFRLASRNDSVRSLGITRIDSLVDSLIAHDRPAAAERVMGDFAMGMWGRAQRMLERPTTLSLHEWERDAHALTAGAPALRRLPAIPRTSPRIGVSEAEWAARLFSSTAALTRDSRRRSAWHRLALAPWVVLGRWAALDSAAKSMLVIAPNDSTVLPARALAAYKRIGSPVHDQPAAMALFDSALRHMPRPDSLAFDTFDDVLTRDDDNWRYGFLPSDRVQLDKRGWAVLDPIWSTPVNEIRLAKRARVAEANYRYADIAPNGQMGSETDAGIILLRRGTPDSGWTTTRDGPFRRLARSWTGVRVSVEIEDAPDAWRVAYAGTLSANKVARWSSSKTSNCGIDASVLTLRSCVQLDGANWTGVPFYGVTDTIDVSITRFRAPGDSTDLLIGARLPLRRFRFRDGPGATRDDRITMTALLATSLGDVTYEQRDVRALPAERELAWTTQWTPRTGARNIMHRIEALEPTQPRAARGVLLYTSDKAVNFPLRGFGISDVLVASSIKPRGESVRRWSDVTIAPNAGVVAPGAGFAIGWEIYDLMPAPDGRVRWRTSIRREDGALLRRNTTREMMQGTTTAGDRLLAEEPDAPAVMYDRDASASAAMFEHIDFNMGNFPPGRHVVEVRIDDLVAKKSVSRSVSVRVLVPDAQRRAPLARTQRLPLR